MDSLNLFGSDSTDSIQSSRFAANLRKETYDPLLITFNSIRTAKKPNKDAKTIDAKKPDAAKDPNQPTRSAASLDVFSQKMVLASKSFDSLDAAQRKTQTESSCDYIVYVPSSFEVKKETMNAFYDAKFKQFFERKTDFNNAAANIFMSWNMFESFVNFSKLNSHRREIALIELSYDAAKKEVGNLINAPTKLLNLENEESKNISFGEQYAVVYSTPTRPALDFLAYADVFSSSTGRLKDIVKQKMLTYFSNYFQAVALYNNESSVGRIPKYIPLLNSNLAANGGATPINHVLPNAAPSRNVEVISDFLIGIMTNKNLANRTELRFDKLKAIREKTYLCTFKSTTEYSMNYDTLLKRLYYKYPCYLTPSLMLSSDDIEKMENKVIHAFEFGFTDKLRSALSECKEINACGLIYAVAVATQEFILMHTDVHFDRTQVLQYLMHDIDFGSGEIGSHENALNMQVSRSLTEIEVHELNIQANQLNPLIGAGCAVANAVYATAIHQALIAPQNSMTIHQDMRTAMNSAIKNQFNFAGFMYDNSTLLSALKYSDQPPVHAMYPKHADYLKTLYKSVQSKEQADFNQVSDEMLYVIHGPLYFDYEWIFRQDPSLIKHILGEELPSENTAADTAAKDQWIRREDPLTENVHYINRNPTNPNYPKMRFDNPTALPKNIEPTRGFFQERSYTQIWKELYISPQQAREERGSVKDNVLHASEMTDDIKDLGPEFETWNTHTGAANDIINDVTQEIINSLYNWTSPGYYRYELTVTNQRASGEQLINRFTQLMRPVETGGIQDYTEPNLPTAYPPPLMFITPPMRGPTNSFMVHAWIPDLSSEISPSYRVFMTLDSNGKASLNRGAYMEHLYKMMQLIFKTIVLSAKNARGTTTTTLSASSSESNRTCVKIMAIGYGSTERNLKMVSQDDKKFIGDSFFYAVRDYSMFYEQENVNVIVYYDEATQQDVRQRYNEYTSQREAVLLKTGSSTSTTIDANLRLKILPVDDFFTLKFPIGKLQLQEKDLLYFVNYCSSPRSFIGNCGEWPENIEEVVNDAILGFGSGQPPLLFQSMRAAAQHIRQLYTERKIELKMIQIHENLQNWNDKTTIPKTLVSAQERIRDKYVKYNDGDTVVKAGDAHGRPMNVNLSWWKGFDADSNNALPRNAYMSSFDEHVLILHNLLTLDTSLGHFVPLVFGDGDANATNNCGPYTNDAANTASTFENAVYAYVQAKKILTMLSKIKPDNIQIEEKEIDIVKSALAAMTVNMSWSMDAKFAAGACEGAFIPNSSVLHNPFVCTQVLDINKWQYVDFDDIASREISGTYPLMAQLKKFVDAKIQESVGVSQVASANSATSNSGILVISKQPSVELMRKNMKVIFENLFQKNAPLRIDGKEMVLNNYAWPEERLYCKMRNDARLASFKSGSGAGGDRKFDFAELRGLRSSSAKKCIEFPLFVVQLMFTLFEGKLSDMTLLDQASLSCISDETMFQENLKIVWEQMMRNLKAKEQNFTIANIFKRVGLNSVDAEYDYTAYFDGDEVPDTGTHSASILINCTNAATNPLLKTTNAEMLKRINDEVSNDALRENERLYNTPPLTNPNELPPINPIGTYNSIRALAKVAEIFNVVEMHGVSGTEIPTARLNAMQVNLRNLIQSGDYEPQLIQSGNAPRIGWNAAKQTESTMLYVSSIVSVKGNLQDISNDLLSMKPGDKILIKTDTNAAEDRKILSSMGTRLKQAGKKIAKVFSRFKKNADSEEEESELGEAEDVGSVEEEGGPGESAESAAENASNIRFEKSQMWMITDVPTRNPGFPKIINIPVYHFRMRFYNLLGGEIMNETKLKVEFQKFSNTL